MNQDPRIRLVIADDHDLYRDGLRTLLSKDETITVVGEAANGRALVQICRQEKPDVVLADIMMPVMSGIEATAILLKELPAIRVVALSMSNDDSQVVDMMAAGAAGYLLKNAHKSEILEAVHSVMNNLPYYCKSTSMKLARLIGASTLAQGDRKVQFTERELVVIRMICQEKTSREIGDTLFISPRTVEEYRERIREKMGVRSSTGIVIYAMQHGIFNPKEHSDA